MRSGGRDGRWLLSAGIGGMLFVTILPVSAWLTTILENRFERPLSAPSEVQGIIVLGGAQSSEVTFERDSLALSGEAERMIEGLALAMQYPEAKLIFSGHSAAMLENEFSEAQVNERFIEMMQFDRERVIMESRSRNTYENALYSQELLNPAPDDIYIVVTSAAHMPRAMGIFRQLAWPVIAWPADYKTKGFAGINNDLALGGSLSDLDAIMREWIGLTAYYWLGRTNEWLPGEE